MTYSPIIPNAIQSPADQRLQVQTNFAQFAAIFSSLSGGLFYNHTPLNNPTEGNHESVILQQQTTDPTVNSGSAAIYCKPAPSKAGTQPQLFLRIPKFLPTQIDETNAPNTPMQLTYNSVNTTGPNQYQSFLAGGYLIFFGTDSGTTVPNTRIIDTITLSPSPTSLLIALVQPNTQTSSGQPMFANTTITSANTFTINSGGNGSGSPITYSFSWLAIGTV